MTTTDARPNRQAMLASGEAIRAATCENESSPRRCVNTNEGLTHSSGTSREGLGMKPTHDDTPRGRSINGHIEATRLVIAIGGLQHDIRSMILTGSPYSKSRPRFSRTGKTYVPKKDREAEDATANEFRALFLGEDPMPGNVALACIFYRPNFQRIDVDNMLKHICDAANKIAWHDDSQVTALFGRVELDADDPRTIVAMAPHESTMLRGADATYPCPVCQTPILAPGQSNRRKTCSRECAARYRGLKLLDDLVPCAWCQTPFKRVSQYRKYCSPQCRADAFRDVRRAATKPPLRCTSCGEPLSHRRGGRCRDCWRADPANTNPPPAQGELPLDVAQ